jgi:hypothetical protein
VDDLCLLEALQVAGLLAKPQGVCNSILCEDDGRGAGAGAGGNDTQGCYTLSAGAARMSHQIRSCRGGCPGRQGFRTQVPSCRPSSRRESRWRPCECPPWGELRGAAWSARWPASFPGCWAVLQGVNRAGVVVDRVLVSIKARGRHSTPAPIHPAHSRHQEGGGVGWQGRVTPNQPHSQLGGR